MASLVDACIFVAASAGTGSFVVASPVPGWRTPASAGAVNGATYRYRAYSADQSEWEVGTGVYTSGTTTLTRSVILAGSNAGAAVDFAVAPSVALTVFSEDFATPAQLAKVDYLTVTGAINLDTVKTKTDYLTVTASTDLDTIRTKAGHLTVTAATDLDTIRTKAGHLTVTAATDLDTIRTSVAALGTAATKDTGTSAGQVPVLDGSGLLATSVLPAIAVTDVFVVVSEAAMLALTAQTGDIAIRTDTNETYVLSTNSPSTLADWKEVIAPTDDKMAKAQNLNDVVDKPTAFTNIKQAASTTATGVVELATDAETVALTDTSRAITPSNLAAFLAANPGVNVQRFTSSGTWTKPSAGTVAWVIAWGAGGSGGRGGSAPRAGGGGGGGARVERVLLLSSTSATETVTIGAGGTARASPNTTGIAGGNTSFGSHVVAYGGGAGGGAPGSDDGSGGGGGGGIAGAGGNGANNGSTGGTAGLGAVDIGIGGAGGAEGSPGVDGALGGGGGGGGGQTTGSAGGNIGGSASYGAAGGGGGNDDSSPGVGGTSLYSGNGGAGANGSSTATSGVAPGGGGGGSASGTSGAGARGELWVIVI